MNNKLATVKKFREKYEFLKKSLIERNPYYFYSSNYDMVVMMWLSKQLQNYMIENPLECRGYNYYQLIDLIINNKKLYETIFPKNFFKSVSEHDLLELSNTMFDEPSNRNIIFALMFYIGKGIRQL